MRSHHGRMNHCRVTVNWFLIPRVKRSSGWLAQWLQDLIGAGLAILAGVGVLAVGAPAKWFEALSYDLPFLQRPDPALNEIVIVANNAMASSSIGPPESSLWDRQRHGDLLNRLTTRGARLVVFAEVFDAPSPTNLTDRAFAAALRRARGKVVLAGELERSPTGSSIVRQPISELASAAPWGLLESSDGRDDVIRQHSAHPEYPSLAGKPPNCRAEKRPFSGNRSPAANTKFSTKTILALGRGPI